MATKPTLKDNDTVIDKALMQPLFDTVYDGLCAGTTPEAIRACLGLEGELEGARMVVVDTAADLRAHANATDPNLVFLTLGALEAGDGGGGTWAKLPTAAPGTYVDNLGTILVPTWSDGSVAYGRLYSGPVNGAWFGMKADGEYNGGSLPYAGTDNTAALLAAINVIERAPKGTPPSVRESIDSGGVLYIPPGKYRFNSGSIEALVDGIKIEAKGATFLNENTVPLLVFGGVRNDSGSSNVAGVEIIGLRIIGFNTGYQIYARKTTRFILNNVTIEGANLSGQTVFGLYVENVQFLTLLDYHSLNMYRSLHLDASTGIGLPAYGHVVIKGGSYKAEDLGAGASIPADDYAAILVTGSTAANSILRLLRIENVHLYAPGGAGIKVRGYDKSWLDPSKVVNTFTPLYKLSLRNTYTEACPQIVDVGEAQTEVNVATSLFEGSGLVSTNALFNGGSAVAGLILDQCEINSPNAHWADWDGPVTLIHTRARAAGGNPTTGEHFVNPTTWERCSLVGDRLDASSRKTKSRIVLSINAGETKNVAHGLCRAPLQYIFTKFADATDGTIVVNSVDATNINVTGIGTYVGLQRWTMFASITR
jgi:hypothetical protein